MGGAGGASKPNYDLDVTYIERTPRYYRYCVIGILVPQVCGSYINRKQWPSVGESITYTAHVINKGSRTTVSSGFDYEWFIDGVSVKKGAFSQRLAAQKEATFQYQTVWPSTPNKVEFRVNTTNTIPDTIVQNNSLTIGSRDLTISIWVETGNYNALNSIAGTYSSYSFEDFLERHFAQMNERFKQAVYPTAPAGVPDRVRVDKIVVADEIDSGSLLSTDPDMYLIDGRWGFGDGDTTNAVGRNGAYQAYAKQVATSTDWGLIHELGHQLGVIDLYRMGIYSDTPQTPNGGISIKDLNGNVVLRNNLPFPLFPYSGLYAGGDTRPYNDGTYFESHTAGGLNSNAGQRRGFIGDYLFDIPTSTTIRLLDVSSTPIVNAQVWLYQKDAVSEYVDDIPEITGTTDGQGNLLLTNRTVQGGTTATGHTLRTNPFGQVDILGRNGNMIIRVDKNNKEGYGFLTLDTLNVAYWSGNKDQATITIKTNYPKITKIGF